MKKSRVLVAVSVVVSLVSASDAPLAQAPKKAPTCPAIEVGTAGWPQWWRLKPPDFPPAPARAPNHGNSETPSWIQSMAVDPKDPSRLYAASWYHLMESSDTGCSWRPIFSLPEVPTQEFPFSQVHKITSIALGGRTDKGSVVYLTIDDSNAARFAIARTVDGGKSWETITDGLPVAGASGPEIALSPRKPQTLHLALRRVFPTSLLNPYLFESRNRGDTWEERTRMMDEAESRIQQATSTNRTTQAANTSYGIAADPVDPKVVWMWDALRIRRSRDGGTTWQDSAPPDDVPTYQIEVFRPNKKSRPRLWLIPNLGFGSDQAIYYSDDEASSWVKLEVPDIVWALTPGRTRKDVVISTRTAGIFGNSSDHSVFEFRDQLYRRGIYPWLDITPEGIPWSGIDLIHSAKGKDSVFYLPTYFGIESYRG